MERLIVSLERDRILLPVGSIRGEDLSDAVPISLSLPLQEEAFTPTQTKNFFEELISQGLARAAELAERIHATGGIRGVIR